MEVGNEISLEEDIQSFFMTTGIEDFDSLRSIIPQINMCIKMVLITNIIVPCLHIMPLESVIIRKNSALKRNYLDLNSNSNALCSIIVDLSCDYSSLLLSQSSIGSEYKPRIFMDLFALFLLQSI